MFNRLEMKNCFRQLLGLEFGFSIKIDKIILNIIAYCHFDLSKLTPSKQPINCVH